MTHPIEMLEVGFRYSGNHPEVLRQVSLQIARQELVAVLGASGSGKSTLLRLMAGLLPPSTGKVLLCGRTAGEIRPADRRVGFVFQHLALFPNLTAEANIAFGLQYSKLSPTEKRRRLSELISSLQLSECIAKRPHQLSGGQAQRVALARALAPGPEILLLDEPFSSLDRPLADAARALVVRLHRELTLTTVLVTHDREQALSVADRIVVLGRGGRIQQVSTADDVYENPVNTEVARLTGGLNLVSGVLTNLSEGTATVAVGGRSVTARWMGPTQTPPDSSVKLAFRPEWADLLPDGASAPAGLDVLVTQVVQTGSRHHVHCTCGSDELLIETQAGEVAVVGRPARIGFAAEKPLAYPTDKET